MSGLELIYSVHTVQHAATPTWLPIVNHPITTRVVTATLNYTIRLKCGYEFAVFSYSNQASGNIDKSRGIFYYRAAKFSCSYFFPSQIFQPFSFYPHRTLRLLSQHLQVVLVLHRALVVLALHSIPMRGKCNKQLTRKTSKIFSIPAFVALATSLSIIIQLVNLASCYVTSAQATSTRPCLW